MSFLVNLLNVMFKFVFTSDANGNKNNIYIDDINIDTNPVGIQELNNESLNNISIVPNPSNGQNTLLSISLTEASQIKTEITDVLGKLININTQRISSGDNSFNLFNSTIPASGIYFVRVTIGSQQVVKKIVIE